MSMFRRRPHLLTGDALLAKARELGVDVSGDARINAVVTNLEPLMASDYEIQRRVLEAERQLRERKMLWVAIVLPVLSAFVAVGSLIVVIHNGKVQISALREALRLQQQQQQAVIGIQLREHRDALGAQLGLEMVKRFDSPDMRRARSGYAQELLKSKEVTEERVLDFFETLALYLHHGRMDEDTVYNGFSFWIDGTGLRPINTLRICAGWRATRSFTVTSSD